MSELLFLIPLAALVWLLWRSEKRCERLEDQRTTERATLLLRAESEREKWAEERISLLNRIQAPEVEVARVYNDEDPEPTSLPFDDDEAYHKYREAVNGER